MSGAARDAILQGIRTALRDQAPAPYPASAVAPWTPSPSRRGPELLSAFREELRLVGGDCRLVAKAAELPAAVARYIEEGGWARVVIADRPAVRDAVSALLRPAIRTGAATDIERADCSVVQAESLLADSGSAIVVLFDRAERLLPYLPPVCIIIGSVWDLHAGMTDAALEPMYGPARRGIAGEAVIITGPSRTADIEKTLVLGAHGPHTLTVFLVSEMPSVRP
ncbi:MAG: LUD domain-containing protein [Candidatus Eremiobacteraeota bacterium]|nr:LUD domain-containing protein [Candidatus Eremiobacteraeota bacterium]